MFAIYLCYSYIRDGLEEGSCYTDISDISESKASIHCIPIDIHSKSQPSLFYFIIFQFKPNPLSSKM